MGRSSSQRLRRSESPVIDRADRGKRDLRFGAGTAQERVEEECPWRPRDCASSRIPRKTKRMSSNPSISIRLSELYPLLAQAYRDNYVWLRDFEDDELLVSNDLYEVVRAFSNCRPSA